MVRQRNARGRQRERNSPRNGQAFRAFRSCAGRKCESKALASLIAMEIGYKFLMLSPEVQTMPQAAEYFPSNSGVQPADRQKPIVPRNAAAAEIAIIPTMLVDGTPKSTLLFHKFFR